ncbi:hypothetical protein RB2150_02724 [Rhodobacteraceae bacterium HTCC2150]|nr:hypothetical protein RB2150_02724 [Rhodobacteraceae bacterium HTCC2150]
MSIITVLLAFVSLPTSAHEVRPAVADFKIVDDQLELSIRLNLEAMMAEIDLSTIANTDEAEEAETYTQLRELSDGALGAKLQTEWDNISSDIKVLVNDAPISLNLVRADVPNDTPIDLARETTVYMTAALPAGASSLQIGWARKFGALVLRQDDSVSEPYTGYLQNGDISPAINLAGGGSQSTLEALWTYGNIGFVHIVPKGLDHILFVLGLFLLSLKMRPLLMQITAFTLAHTVTLALGILGFVTISPAIVEPLIALSIVYVAVENIVVGKLSRWRPLIVFGFGLLHGLGFASVLGDIGLNPSQFITGLIGFNIGVEIGQLFVIAIAFLAVSLWFRNKPWYRSRITNPASAMIAFVAAYWTIERVFF